MLITCKWDHSAMEKDIALNQVWVVIKLPQEISSRIANLTFIVFFTFQPFCMCLLQTVYPTYCKNTITVCQLVEQYSQGINSITLFCTLNFICVFIECYWLAAFRWKCSSFSQARRSSIVIYMSHSQDILPTCLRTRWKSLCSFKIYFIHLLLPLSCYDLLDVLLCCFERDTMGSMGHRIGWKTVCLISKKLSIGPDWKFIELRLYIFRNQWGVRRNHWSIILVVLKM